MNTQVSMIETLRTADRLAMTALLDRCFEGVSEAVFAADLQDKTHAVLMHDTRGRLVGFSTLAIWPTEGPTGQPATIVCSGDTIVAPEAWGSWALPRQWIRAVYDLHQSIGRGELYWLLICSGFRTFRFLPVFVQRFVIAAEPPASSADEAEDLTSCWRWMNRLAEQRWAHRFDSALGIVRLDHPQRLRSGLSDIPSGRAEQPDVKRFVHLNPGHQRGDELVCLASLARDNLTPAGRRMLAAPVRSAGN